MDPIEVIVADVARSTLTGCARNIVNELERRVGGGQELADQLAAEEAVKGCLSMLLQVRSSADFGAISAKALRKFGRALGEFAGVGDAQEQLLRPYTEEACDQALMVAELDRLWRVNQESLELPQLPAGYWAQALAEYCAAAEVVVPGSPLLQRARGLGPPRRLTVLPEAMQLLERYRAADVNPRRTTK